MDGNRDDFEDLSNERKKFWTACPPEKFRITAEVVR